MTNKYKRTIAERVGRVLGITFVTLVGVLIFSAIIFFTGAIWHTMFKFFM